MTQNLLIQGDNLKGLQYLLDEKKLKGCIDLVYIDPPFATGNRFTVGDSRSNTISNKKQGTIAYSDTMKKDDFLDFLQQRLILIHELLSQEGSIYLHIDYKIGHYVKVLMDSVFGIDNFRNDITRIKCNPKNFKRLGYGNIKDMILFYTKTADAIWHEPFEPYSENDLERLFPKTDVNGRKYTTVPIHAPGETLNGESGQPFLGILPPKGRHWRTDVETLNKWNEEGLIEWSANGNPRKIIFADEQIGKRRQDIWEFKDPLYPQYPTEKNADLIDSIIKTSSNESSIVLDCFCGSGTTLKVAQKNNRRWIGIDQSPIAINTTKNKLKNIDNNLFQPITEYSFLCLDESKTQSKANKSYAASSLPCQH